ncbi:hypothetical protein [Streptomyces sp. NPDC088350]|uniref:hypothetical protein n=1 Tax=Streptomyces sp. NPDC088350 TaxID=3365854 RepID=UPI0038178FB6
MVVGLIVFLARFATTTADARKPLIPLSAAFALGGVTLALSATGGALTATPLHSASAAAFTMAEMLHAVISWELSVALAPGAVQGTYLAVHRLAQSTQRSIGPLAVTTAIATGPLGRTVFGAAIALTCMIQHRLVREPLARTPLSVPPVTVSEH